MAAKTIAWNTGTGNITLTYQGQGDGTISVQSDANDIGSARSQVITIETTEGSPVITKNLTISQAACPFPVGDVKNYSYTGSYQEVELPAGKYKLQCWGAQGGSNGTNSSYGITAQSGGKGGYSEGVLTLSQKTIVRIYVGGQGTASAGGYNGGGSTTGTSQYNSSDEFGYSKMGGGGGATDIRLSDGALLSRMIVAGGGAGGAMCYRSKTTTTTTFEQYASGSGGSENKVNNNYWDRKSWEWVTPGDDLVFYIMPSSTTGAHGRIQFAASSGSISITEVLFDTGTNFTVPSGAEWVNIIVYTNGTSVPTFNYLIQKKITTTVTNTDTNHQVGGVGGGTSGGGYSSTYQGKQNGAGSGGSFGQGANQTDLNWRYCSGAGGGGWYGGGGGQRSDSTMTYCKYSGGGSGFVNTAASAGNRPSGYTGLQLDSGETKDGATSFPNTAGTGNETGHSGNGYARITRLA